jgi:hypothetical protein
MRRGDRPLMPVRVVNFTPSADGAGQSACNRFRAEMPSLGVLADEENEFEIRQMLEKARAPDFGALAARRQIPALVIETGETEPHRHDCDLSGVIEYAFPDPEPAAQTDAGRIGVRAPRRMDTGARRLA